MTGQYKTNALQDKFVDFISPTKGYLDRLRSKQQNINPISPTGYHNYRPDLN